MDVRKETPEEQSERLRQEELKRNPSGAFGDGMNRAEFGSLADLVGGLGWKGTGILILLLVIGYVLYKLLF
ncbi:hypothetical protein PACILC2_11680 [Paenibacillus cisolokensis]|uniref:Phage capsid protein n=1 Tax=Paenibacillus cisolokensis TaxID=1658519 RepID=A0ABQ4N358_9BACL|nr:DUF6366 family protein [Paenibacillus cisolokensis]GIQ62600.1 hypothetical protein PACILC2_11680 [Paenibacillus cisolokensis]